MVVGLCGFVIGFVVRVGMLLLRVGCVVGGSCGYSKLLVVIFCGGCGDGGGWTEGILVVGLGGDVIVFVVRVGMLLVRVGCVMGGGCGCGKLLVVIFCGGCGDGGGWPEGIMVVGIGVIVFGFVVCGGMLYVRVGCVVGGGSGCGKLPVVTFVVGG